MSSMSSVYEQTGANGSPLAVTASGSHSAASTGDACDKVFSIGELVGLILERVPIHHRSELRRVSTQWSSIIIRIGYAVRPSCPFSHGSGHLCLCPQDHDHSPEKLCADVSDFQHDVFHMTKVMMLNMLLDGRADWEHRSDAGKPYYKFDAGICINPAINSVVKPNSWPSGMTVTLQNVDDRSALLSMRQEFITSPPITMVMLSLRQITPTLFTMSNHDSCDAMLREDAGIRVEDLLDIFDRMRAHVHAPGVPVDRASRSRPYSTGLQAVAVFRHAGTSAITSPREQYPGPRESFSNNEYCTSQ